MPHHELGGTPLPPAPGPVTAGPAPNRYREAAAAALAAATAARQALVDAFGALQAEQLAGDWLGRSADDWWRQAAGQRSLTLGGLDTDIAACRRLVVGEPTQVAVDDVRARHPGPARSVPGTPPGQR